MRVALSVGTTLFLIVLCFVVITAGAQEGSLSPAGKLFIKETSSSNLMEVQLGRVAHDKGSVPQVRDYGDQMVLDYGKASEELTAIAAQSNLKLPVLVVRKHTLLIARLSKLSGREFDGQYLQAMLKSHTTNIARFNKALKKVKDPDLKAWAVATLPMLQQHLQQAKDAAQGLVCQ